jgi:subtilisin family serine protease
MSLRLLTCLLILSVGHGEEVHNIRGGTTKEKGGATGIENSDGVLDVDISSNTSKRQSGAFSLVDAKEEAITLDPDSHRKPKTLIEKEKMTNEAKASKNAKTVMKKDTTTSDEQQSSVHMTHARLDSIHQAAQTKAQPESTNSTSGNKGRMRGLTVETLHRRADGGVKTCEGLQKIVQCKDGVEEEVCKQDLVDAGVEVVSDMVNTTFFAICVDTQKEVDLVAELADVEGVEDDPPRTLSYVHGSEEVVRLLQNNRQVVPYGVDLVNAPDFWDRYGTKGGGVKVCVIDTGLRATHEDIKDLELSGSDGNNVISEWYEDGNSHGTHVTGTIAGVDNNIGVVGVAPEASIHVVRVFNDNGQFTASSLVVAMNACASANAKIISMSLGGPVDTFAERTAVRLLRNSGILLVAASGNDANGINLVEYPAGYDPVVSVGALDDEFQIAEFSTHNTEVDIAGPGVGVLSSTSNTDRSYAKLSGTSMATPHIAGVAALLWSRFPNSSVDEIREAMEQSARDIGACGKDRLFGNGVVDVVAAAEYLENGGNVAPELGGCIDVSVELKTDDWGQETTYIITPKQGGFFNNQDDDIVYRGGPYPNNRRSTYRDNIRLEDGCYNLVWRDSYGDG